MSYQTYITEAIVCGSILRNTSDKKYFLFSQGSGMLLAHARSVREERSKQRYALQDFSRIRVSLLKGKNGWRIGSVESYGNPFLQAQNRSMRGHVSFIISQLRRYVQGEISLPRTYSDSTALLCMPIVDPVQQRQYQHIFLLRLLSELGYVAAKPQWRSLIEEDLIENALSQYEASMYTSIAHAIEAGTQASHL